MRDIANLRRQTSSQAIDMPGSTDGLKLAAAVRDRWPPIKIVIVPGHRNPTAGELPVRSIFFAKPYAEDMLIKTIQEMVRSAV